MNAYQRAVRDIVNARSADLDDGLSLWRAALDRDENLAEAYRAYQTEAIKNAEGEKNNLANAKEALASAARKAGITKDVIEPPCRCKLCNDTGYVNGGYCSCVVKRVINSDRENLSLPTVDFDKAQATAPKAIAKLYKAAKVYIDKPQEKPFFVVSGSPGAGKTMLVSAIATEFIKRGRSAVTVSAFEFVRRAKEYHTQFAIEDYKDLFTPMLDCDILVIDDLGTEVMLKNITREYLFTVINERWLRKKNTVVTTNLSNAEVMSRYGESIFSRMYDKNVSSSYTITANNTRIDGSK